MPTTVWCDVCNREFSSRQYYAAHLSSDRGATCRHVFFNSARKPMKHGLSIPMNRFKGGKKKALIERIGALLSEQERNEEETKVSEVVDYSVFDFNDSDSDGSLEIVYPAAAATVEEDVPEIRKIDEFRQYTEQAKVDYRRLSPKMSAAIELMDLMNHKGGNTALFDAVFEWHVKHIGCTEKMTDACLHQELVERYNLEDTKPFEVPTKNAKLQRHSQSCMS